MHIVVCTLLPGSCGILGVRAGAREGTTLLGSGRPRGEAGGEAGGEALTWISTVTGAKP